MFRIRETGRFAVGRVGYLTSWFERSVIGMRISRSAGRIADFLRADNPYQHGHVAAAVLLPPRDRGKPSPGLPTMDGMAAFPEASDGAR